MRKSECTRARLQQVALDLIAEQEFEGTTVEQIAAAAGVSQMTFFRYFPTKAAVVLNDPFDPQIAAAGAAQPGDIPPLARACRGLRAGLAGLNLPDQQQARQRVRIVGHSPSLAASVWAANTAATEEVMTAALATHAPEPDSRVAAAAVLGALTAALLDWGARDDDETLAACILRALEVLDPRPNRPEPE